MRMSRLPPCLLLTACLLGGANGGCGTAAGVARSPAADALASAVVWVGVDSRPLAVGTTATLSFEAIGSADCCANGYSVGSTAADVIAVADLGNQTLELQAVAAGAATIEVFAPDGSLVGGVPLTAETPASVSFADPSHLVAQIQGDTELPPSGFSLIQGGEAILQAVIEDAVGNQLASQGLASCQAVGGGLSVKKEEPERFVLEALPGAEHATLVCGLASDPSTDVSYPVHVVAAAQSASFQKSTGADGSVVAVVDALDASGLHTLGLGQWTFHVTDPGYATPLADAAVQVVFPTGATAGSATLTATSQDGTLTASTQIP